MTVTPSELFGLNKKKGRIKAGMDADIVIFDEDINIINTMVMGNI
jgi:N-acetylglucosamine-6-phosphate deacetylase